MCVYISERTVEKHHVVPPRVDLRLVLGRRRALLASVTSRREAAATGMPWRITLECSNSAYVVTTGIVSQGPCVTIVDNTKNSAYNSRRSLNCAIAARSTAVPHGQQRIHLACLSPRIGVDESVIQAMMRDESFSCRSPRHALCRPLAEGAGCAGAGSSRGGLETVDPQCRRRSARRRG